MEEESLAWHIAGHAHGVLSFGFDIHALSLDGFTREELDDASNCVRLDECTLLQAPEVFVPVGCYGHTHAMENLCRI